MKTRLHFSRRSGYALLMVMVILSGLVLIFAGTMSRTYTAATLNERNNQYTLGLYAAEAATEKVFARLKWDYMQGDLTQVSNNMSVYNNYYPGALSSEDSYWSNWKFSDGRGNPNKTYVGQLTSQVYTQLQSQYSGLSGWATKYRILSNVKSLTSRYNITNAVQQDIELDNVPVFQYAIFYNNLMEYTWCATFTINGRVHCNTNIFVGSSANLTFNTLVTTSKTISSPAWDGHAATDYTGSVRYNASPAPGYSTNAQTYNLPDRHHQHS